MRCMKRSRSRPTAGSAFSEISSEALVCWMNTLHRPSRTPERRTTSATRLVSDSKLRPRVWMRMASRMTIGSSIADPHDLGFGNLRGEHDEHGVVLVLAQLDLLAAQRLDQCRHGVRIAGHDHVLTAMTAQDPVRQFVPG